MFGYVFKHGTFYFRIQANDDDDALMKAKRAIEETAPAASNTYLKVDLTAGAFEGRIYLEPETLTKSNICRKVILPNEGPEDAPF